MISASPPICTGRSRDRLTLPRSHDHRAKSVSADSPNLKIIMDYEFVDDTYSILSEVEKEEDVVAEEREVWDDKGRLLPNSRPYSKSR